MSKKSIFGFGVFTAIGVFLVSFGYSVIGEGYVEDAAFLGSFFFGSGVGFLVATYLFYRYRSGQVPPPQQTQKTPEPPGAQQVPMPPGAQQTAKPPDNQQSPSQSGKTMKYTTKELFMWGLIIGGAFTAIHSYTSCKFVQDSGCIQFGVPIRLGTAITSVIAFAVASYLAFEWDKPS